VLWLMVIPVTPTLIVSRIIKSALKLILDTLIFTIQHCHQGTNQPLQRPKFYDTLFHLEVSRTSL
jgi:hypothetical protein